ncbi:MAG: hypothetical protein ACOC7V_01195, partial [Spirochaetota bacterium]
MRRRAHADLPDASGFDLATRKLAVMSLVLNARRELPDLFSGGYTPLSVSGVSPDRAIAFARRADGGRTMATVALRHHAPSSAGMRLQLPYELATGEYIDLLSGATVDVVDASIELAPLLTRWPAALLWRAGASARSGG